MEIIKINDVEYYSSKKLKENDPLFFRGVRSLKNIISKKNIPDDQFIYVTHSISKNEYKPCNKEEKRPPKAFPLITVEWCHANVPSFEQNELKEELLMAPPILELTDDEKFKDDAGNIYEIETRGEDRKINNVYFLCRDVSKAFGIKSVKDTIIKSNYFDKNKDYVNINRKPCGKVFSLTTKCLFLTYYGVLKLLYRSNSKKASAFTDWASETLFTIQMGSKEKKEDLASEILGVSLEHVKTLSKVSVSKIPCVYVFSLGYVKDLRKSMNIKDDIDDNNIVIKFGLTDNLIRRANEHVKEYQENIENSKVRLMYYNYIDKKYMYEGEKEIRDYFNESGDLLEYKKYKELAVLSSKNKKHLKSQFRYLNDTYGGDMQTINLQFEKEKERFTHELKIKDIECERKIEKIKLDAEKQIEILNHEKMLENVKHTAEIKILKKDNELLEKDKKLLEMEKRFLELQLK